MSSLNSDASSPRVLIVEDDLDLRELMSEILTDEGFAVSPASTGTEAVVYLKNHPMPNLILMDLSLPEMSGDELMGHLSAHPDRSQAKIVVVSGWDDVAARAHKLGADGFMKKPLELGTISSTLKRIMSPG